MQINSNYNFPGEFTIEEIEELIEFFRDLDGKIESPEVEQLVARIAQLKLSDVHVEKPKKVDLVKKKMACVSPIQKAKHDSGIKNQVKKALSLRTHSNVPSSVLRPITQEVAAALNSPQLLRKKAVARKKMTVTDTMQVTQSIPVVDDSSNKENQVEKAKKQDLVKKKMACVLPIQKAKHAPRRDSRIKRAISHLTQSDVPLFVPQPIPQEIVACPKPKKQVRWEAMATHKMTFAEGRHITQSISVVDESSGTENREPETKEEAAVQFEANCQRMNEWKRLPKEFRPVGRNRLGMRVDRSLTERAQTMRHISLIVLENLQLKSLRAQPQ